MSRTSVDASTARTIRNLRRALHAERVRRFPPRTIQPVAGNEDDVRLIRCVRCHVLHVSRAPGQRNGTIYGMSMAMVSW